MSCNKDGTPYHYAGASIRTADLFSLPGLAAPCWLVAIGSAFCPEDLPCKTRLLYNNKKEHKDGSLFKCWDFSLSHL